MVRVGGCGVGDVGVEVKHGRRNRRSASIFGIFASGFQEFCREMKKTKTKKEEKGK